MFKKIFTIALLATALQACTPMNGVYTTSEMEFCWERGLNFVWIDEFDAGCVEPVADAMPSRISKIRWIESQGATYYEIRKVSKEVLINQKRTVL